MFYRPEAGSGLPHNPFKAVVSPRPIGWISTRVGGLGDNLAPYSFFNAVGDSPPLVMFAGDPNDSITNACAAGVFAVNIVEKATWRKMNATSARVARGVDEFVLCGVAKAECTTIDCPRVADAPATLECVLERHLVLPGDNHMVIGRVTGIHLRDDCLRDGRFDVTAYVPVARLGYKDYAFVREVRSLDRPE
ncbi:flavin reductase family protein [Rhodobacter sp. Har01]|uniref:flavin reductase family protein n=1 Tax=Rhodobacter sp. Har01 TaxID=2883999 RepID=UPI001D085960|nr:flavin reductase family protein [Rhodobacter sp. Har01]MCB6178669.1 flavin reductase family protein [Rhodobacter sp. Har01]